LKIGHANDVSSVFFFLKKKIKVYNVVFPEKEKESLGAGFCFIGLDTWAFYS
jgi:hypothetical protein